MSLAAPSLERAVDFSMGGRWSTFGFQFICLMVLILSSGLHRCSALDAEGLDLLKFRQNVYYDPYDSLASWNNDENGDPCKWSRVHCGDGKVEMLDLSGLSLKGTLAPELGNLIHLRSLILHGNHFSGSIPRELWRLRRLEVLDLTNNNLSGEIPSEIYLMESLTTLMLCGNTFHGIIPQEIWELEGLTELQFDAELEPRIGRKIGCIRRKYEDQSIIAAGASYGQEIPPYRDQVQRISYQKHQDAIAHRRILLDQPTSPNLEALPPKTGSPPAETPSVPLSISSGSFPARPDSKNTSEAPIGAPTSTSLSSPPPPPSPHQPHESKGSTSTTKTWIYVCIALAVALLIAISLVCFFICRSRGMKNIGPWKTGLSGQLQKAFVTGVPKLNKAELDVACEDFSNIIETHNGCTLYKGTLSSGVEIAVASTMVKFSNDWSDEAELAYRKKIETLSRVNHKNFVNLIGYCEENEPFTRMMVFEYAPNGSLYEHLYVKELEHLDWNARMRIVMGVAYCLQHMHELNPPALHSHIDSKCVRLTDDYAAKIVERVFPPYPKNKDEAKQEGPESQQGDFETNVYDFGMLLLEVITGKELESEERGPLLHWVGQHLGDMQVMASLVDSSLKWFKNEELEVICEAIEECVHTNPEERSTMREIIDKLRQVIAISPESAVPRLSPLWWAELEILSMEGA